MSDHLNEFKSNLIPGGDNIENFIIDPSSKVGEDQRRTITDTEPVVVNTITITSSNGDTSSEFASDDEILGGVDNDIIDSSKLYKDYPIETTMDMDEKLSTNDMPTIILAEVYKKGLAGDHLNSMNTFYTTGIKQIITKLFKAEVNNMQNKREQTEEDREIDTISFSVSFTNAELKSPKTTKYSTQNPEMLTPGMARSKNLTYSAPLYATAEITTTAVFKDGTTKTRTEYISREDNWRIAAIPVMVRSRYCNLYKASAEAAKRLEEDPRDPGGYFIIKGTEWAIDKLENLVINVPHCYLNMYGREIARLTFQSKPGDAYENSYYITIRYRTDHQITIEIVMQKYQQLEIPFYLLFRAFGMTRDIDIINNIIYGIEFQPDGSIKIADDPVTKHMLDLLERAFKAPNKDFEPVLRNMNSAEVIRFIATKMSEMAANPKLETDPNAVKYVNMSTFNLLDKIIFPHIGNDKGFRIRKVKFLGHLIHKLLRVEMGVFDSTDRDHLRNKRIYAAGPSFTKTLKTHFNFSVVQVIRKQLIREFQNTPWSKVHLSEAVKSCVNANDLEQYLITSIVTGEKTITVKRNEVVNRISTQQLYRKNDLNVKSTLNNITTHGMSAAKATDRATDMRAAHGSYYGYIAMAQSADTGEKVGMSKQMTITASIAEASSSHILKDKLLRDPRIIHVDVVAPEEISRRRLTKVFVNGDWIGLCEDSHSLVHYYRTARRHKDINQYTTIVWEILVREVYFWVDVGRLIRPVMIVYNNLADHLDTGGKTPFKQWIKLTKKHIRGLQSGLIKMDDLLEDRIIEYVSSEESENLLIARSLDVLKANVGNILLQYTHCGIEQEMFGIVELSAPNTNHTLASRIVMFTNQKKQTCGWYALNWPYRIDKHTFLQYYCETPIIRAFSSAITYPNDQNTILAYCPYGGWGQEDSLVANQSSIDRGLFNGSHFYFEKTELEKGERFGNPDRARTLDIKKDAIYEYIDESGFIREGTVVQKGYVLIVKTSKLKEPVDNYLYVDRSVVYRLDEPAIVVKVIHPRNDEDTLIAKVKLRSYRPLAIGDKLSSHAGCKGICAIKFDQANMPYCEDGLIPDLIINPHSIPTRMVIGQIIETMMGELAVQQGCLLDGIPFKNLDIDGMIKKIAEKRGLEYAGHRRMYNGRTGQWFNAMIFIGPTPYQRLLKFVADENYAMSTGPTDALTRQPGDGKARDGGLRIGEMEKDVICSHGTMRLLFDKFYNDSDGIELHICRICGNRATVNDKEGLYKCKKCKDNADIVTVPSSWVANLFFNEINAMGVKPTFETTPMGYSQYE
jgi:DNA-directed RNA polymerase beta subunit